LVWDYQRSPAKNLLFLAGYPRLAMNYPAYFLVMIPKVKNIPIVMKKHTDHDGFFGIGNPQVTMGFNTKMMQNCG